VENLLGERALERCGVSDFDFIEGAILDKVHLNSRIFRLSRCPEA